MTDFGVNHKVFSEFNAFAFLHLAVRRRSPTDLFEGRFQDLFRFLYGTEIETKIGDECDNSEFGILTLMEANPFQYNHS